jgi:hypothetical protein
MFVYGISNNPKNIMTTLQNETPDEKLKKQELGQFMTTRYNYILQNCKIPETVRKIIEPFAGNGDLLKFLGSTHSYQLECYDIDPKHNYIVRQDTLLNPPNYSDAFILTNPPYIARNKSTNKQLFDKYDMNDLYKCFMKELSHNRPIGGIVIIPLNYWCSIRKGDVFLRKQFLQIYNIVHLNIFEEQVFDDTTTTVCSFQFQQKMDGDGSGVAGTIPISVYPSNKQFQVVLDDTNQYTIGGQIYQLPISPENHYTITRLTHKNRQKQNTNILVKCIDDNEANQIGLSIVSNENIYIDTTPNLSARTYASLIIEPAVDIETQRRIVERFNQFLQESRTQYHSLFLSNYRESKDIARKRISFDLVYQIVKYTIDVLLVREVVVPPVMEK